MKNLGGHLSGGVLRLLGAVAACVLLLACAQPAAGCTPGKADCTCAGGGCDAGLACVSGVCRDNTGFPGGPCLDATHCHSAARC